ncbi:glycosyltransferase family 4 protein [Salinibacter ruber]|uniref:glycosyltransferase family 4 protein n=1 Tax=Salinibacter ruber TaxID=146919 RepID=UPI0021695CC9|nr:glycosyltransferase family 1 protein [Salinibacter ruber]MCS4040852.1 glycosyltransferase involved in cell wall biosynthesis [Salinibacter ruber]
MNILSFVHPTRTYLPCSGIGRHANNILTRLAERKNMDVELFFSEQWLGEDEEMDPRTPLRGLPNRTFPFPENLTERCWKLFGRPYMDRWVPGDTDLVYSPMETYLPLRDVPVAVTIHDVQAFETDLPWAQSWQHRWFRWKWSTWVHDALQDCRVVFTVSEFSKRRMVELLGADPETIRVVGNGVEPEFFEIAECDPSRLERPCPEPYLFMVGGLRKKKGGDALLSVARRLRERGSDIQLVVAGPNGDAYEAEAKELDNVHLLGWVPDDDMPRLMRGALALLFLSRYEGFGLPAAEAMAAGTPAIVSDAASLPEVVGDAGIVVDPNATDDIVNVVQALDRDRGMRDRYAVAGRERAQTYTWAQCVDRLLTTLQSVR